MVFADDVPAASCPDTVPDKSAADAASGSVTAVIAHSKAVAALSVPRKQITPDTRAKQKNKKKNKKQNASKAAE